MIKKVICFAAVCAATLFVACGRADNKAPVTTPEPAEKITAEVTVAPTAAPTAEPTAAPTAEPTAAPALDLTAEPTAAPTAEPTSAPTAEPTAEPTATPKPTDEPGGSETIAWNDDWQYASNSKIHSDSVTLYRSAAEPRKGITIAVNAGHGTSGGTKVKTLCHPDGSAKVTGGSTGAGETYATAVSTGTSFLDGTAEAKANLTLAVLLKNLLLEEGYDVLMIREGSDTQLDNIARTVYSNNNADCHIAIHYDSTETDKGFFFIGVPNVASYRSMEPVASHWKSHNALGEALVEGVKSRDVKVYSSGNVPLDLTQTSYSTVPSVDVEVGDRKSDYSEKTQSKIAEGIVAGLNIYFGQ